MPKMLPLPAAEPQAARTPVDAAIARTAWATATPPESIVTRESRPRVQWRRSTAMAARAPVSIDRSASSTASGASSMGRAGADRPPGLPVRRARPRSHPEPLRPPLQDRSRWRIRVARPRIPARQTTLHPRHGPDPGRSSRARPPLPQRTPRRPRPRPPQHRVPPGPHGHTASSAARSRRARTPAIACHLPPLKPARRQGWRGIGCMGPRHRPWLAVPCRSAPSRDPSEIHSRPHPRCGAPRRHSP